METMKSNEEVTLVKKFTTFKVGLKNGPLGGVIKTSKRHLTPQEALDTFPNAVWVMGIGKGMLDEKNKEE